MGLDTIDQHHQPILTGGVPWMILHVIAQFYSLVLRERGRGLKGKFSDQYLDFSISPSGMFFAPLTLAPQLASKSINTRRTDNSFPMSLLSRFGRKQSMLTLPSLPTNREKTYSYLMEFPGMSHKQCSSKTTSKSSKLSASVVNPKKI